MRSRFLGARRLLLLDVVFVVLLLLLGGARSSAFLRDLPPVVLGPGSSRAVRPAAANIIIAAPVPPTSLLLGPSSRGRTSEEDVVERPANGGAAAGRDATRRCAPQQDAVVAVEWKVHDDEGLLGGGVTALLLFQSWLFVGTKRGQVFLRRVGLRGDAANVALHNDESCWRGSSQELIVEAHPPTAMPASASTQASSLSKLPVYCLATVPHSNDGLVLLAGGADRYVSVHRLLDSEEDLVLKLVQRLGPHTGWVKDMALLVNDEEGDGKAAAAASLSPRPLVAALFSIGCNGIEVWDVESSNSGEEERGGGGGDANSEYDDARWRHRGKWTVDSSPRGCTLSSDLLCLAFTHDGGNNEEVRLWAGGVDGRIHGWRTTARASTSRVDDTNKCAEWLAHQGRVTRLLVHQNRFLFSSSHDGTIKCWSVDREPPSQRAESVCVMEKRPTSTLHVGDNTRITSMAIVPLDSTAAASTTVWLAFGTQNGSVRLTRLIATQDAYTDGEAELCHSWSLLGQVQLPNEPFIHCLCPISPLVLAVGHANGLTFLSFDVQGE